MYLKLELLIDILDGEVEVLVPEGVEVLVHRLALVHALRGNQSHQ